MRSIFSSPIVLIQSVAGFIKWIRWRWCFIISARNRFTCARNDVSQVLFELYFYDADERVVMTWKSGERGDKSIDKGIDVLSLVSNGQSTDVFVGTEEFYTIVFYRFHYYCIRCLCCCYGRRVVVVVKAYNEKFLVLKKLCYTFQLFRKKITDVGIISAFVIKISP